MVYNKIQRLAFNITLSMNTLCLDFGNTRLKAAMFEHDRLKSIYVLGNDPLSDVNKILDEYNPGVSILSSVINHNSSIDSSLQHRTRFHRLSNTSHLPFSIPVGKPETVGSDRLAIAAASVFLF